MGERVGRETPNIEVAGSNPIPRSFTDLRFFFLFFIFFFTLKSGLFCVLASVCESQLRLCDNK